MFHIYADGKSIYEPIDDELIVNSPKLTLEMGKAGALQFIVPPTHKYYNLFQQLRTIVTVELDGVEIFRGRVLSNNRNFQNMRTIYCEGNLAYLVDSVQQGKKFKGTTHELFRRIIQQHNARVESDKEFRVGTINIEDREIILSGTTDKDDQEQAEALETTNFDYEQIVLNSIVDDWQTSFDYIESCLIDYCGGYLRTRRVGNTNYIDLVTDYGNTAVQEIEFGTNLLDLTEEVSAEDVFTVLIPLGDDNLTIAEVNNGSDELVDAAGVERYGRIVKTHVFDNVNKASTLLENARRFMASHVNMPITVVVKAIDMHLVDRSVREIYVGDRVHVNSLPHDIVDYLVCTKIEYDLNNPANNTYTFGNPRQTMTERYRKDKAKQNKDSKSRGGKGGGAGAAAADEEGKKDLDEFFDAWININKEAAHIDLGALYKKYQDDRETLESQCGISLDAPTGNINIKTLRKEFDELGKTVTDQSAYIDLLNNDLGAKISLVAANHKQLEDLESTHHADITLFANELESRIDMNTESIHTTDGRVTESNTRISQVSNKLQAQINLEASHKKEIDGKITSSNANINAVANDLKAQITLEASHKKEIDGKITDSNANINAVANKLQAQIDLEASHKKEIDGKITDSNANINAVANKLQAQIDLEAQHKEEIDGKITSSNANINAVANKLQAQIDLEAQHKEEIDGKITSSNANINAVANDLKAQIDLEAEHKKGLDKSIASIKVTANNLGSKIELKADKTTLNSKINKINGTINTINGKVTTINSNITTINSNITTIKGDILDIQTDVTSVKNLIASSIDAALIGSRKITAGVLTATKVTVSGTATVSGALSAASINVSSTGSIKIGGNPVATQAWVTAQLANYAASNHSHAWGDITDKPTTFEPATHSHAWSEITSKPTSFKPSSHTHAFSASTKVNNGHTHSVTVSGTRYTTTGVSTNSDHQISISGTTKSN